MFKMFKDPYVDKLIDIRKIIIQVAKHSSWWEMRG